MNRRGFLTASAAVAAAAVPVAIATARPRQSSEYFRFSTDKNDPGYVPYGKLMGDRRDVTVYFDGIKADGVMTADAREGWIKRWVMTDNGNLAHVHGDVITEVVRGDVVIEIGDPPGSPA